ncbi:CPCC family cysteine-rich protein [Catenuloplanes sp. NPDC020197]|uniref:CPCC family cysteine-rich protein n=1 Tax=Catenuloplanes TaxID=33874 RepID=UPI00286AF251|nr:CPCC family cysteine-rich protein [Catenuloplanes niger]
MSLCGSLCPGAGTARESTRRTRGTPVYPRRGRHGKVTGVEQFVVSRCACCGYRTGGGTCPVCFWTEDGSSDRDAKVAKGGPNGDLSLDEARLNFAIYGASHRRYLDVVRKPREDEMP